MTAPLTLTNAMLNQWTDDRSGPVALHLKQKLVPVEGDGGVICPPTYADIGYNIDVLSDGTKVAQIDSVGSQANRMEPLFKKATAGQPPNPLAALVPQIEISLGNEKPPLSLLDLAHRAGDAVVRASTLAREMEEAFGTLKRTGDAEPLAQIAPTSLVFGVWDSRGSTGQKCPRLVRSVIRAYDIDVLHAAAQFNSVWKSLSDSQQAELEKEAKARKVKRSETGFADAPAIFRKTGKGVPQFKDGEANPEARVLGGVIARGDIVREVTINLVALRSLGASNDNRGKKLRHYLLGLSLVAATADQAMYLREGCHLRYRGNENWQVVPRRGAEAEIDFHSKEAQEFIQKYASKSFLEFIGEKPKEALYRFDIKEAKKLLAKKDEEEQAES